MYAIMYRDRPSSPWCLQSYAKKREVALRSAVQTVEQEHYIIGNKKFQIFILDEKTNRHIRVKAGPMRSLHRPSKGDGVAQETDTPSPLVFKKEARIWRTKRPPMQSRVDSWKIRLKRPVTPAGSGKLKPS
jgi:hypothetical protein